MYICWSQAVRNPGTTARRRPCIAIVYSCLEKQIDSFHRSRFRGGCMGITPAPETRDRPYLMHMKCI